MIGNNKYVLRIHHNIPRLKEFHNDALTYKVADDKVASDKYLLALYDEAYYSSYQVGTASKGTYYGTITNNCYSFDGSKFKFLITYPEVGKSEDGHDGAKFALGEVALNLNAGEKLLLRPTFQGNKLLKSDGINETSVTCVISKGLDNNSPHYNNRPETLLTIPQSDIEMLNGQIFDKTKDYWLGQAKNVVVLKTVTGTVVGKLKSTTTLMQENFKGSPTDGYYLWHGNPFHSGLAYVEKIPGDAKVSFFRDSGKVIYEFIDRNGAVGKNFCDNAETPDCKMKNLTLIPNIRTFLKSTLVAADIGDFDNTGSVDEAGVAAILKKAVVNEVADALRNNPGSAIGPRGVPGYTGMPGKPGIHGRNGLDGAMGPQGNPGPPGRDANPADVAEQLVTTKATELVQAVLDAPGSGGENLATQVAGKVNLNPQAFANKVDAAKLTEGVVNKITPGEAKKIAEDTVEAIKSPNSFSQYTEFSKKLAELLFNRSAIDKPKAYSLLESKVSGWGLAKYLLVHSGLSDNQAKNLVETKVDQSRLAHDLLEKAGLNNDASEASATVDHILNHFFSTRVGAVTAALRSNPGRARGPKGDQGETGGDGEQGQDANASEIMHKLAQNTRFKRSLKGDDGSEGPQGIQGLAGQDGPQGPRGREGKQGKRGDDGPEGQQGDPGQDGHQGPRGREGKQGKRGDDGPEGQQGDPGQDGDPGPRGREGKHGKRGEDGSEGLPGKQGPKGDQGQDGPQGPRGREGKQGKRGDDGAEGPQGIQGLAGQDTDPSEIMNRLAQNTRFKRSLKGDDGSEGPQGVQGLAGQDGPQGPRGRDGKQGKRGDDEGPQGIQGLAGQDGPQGPRGREGKQGKRGEDGAEGPPGSQGPKGDQGQDGPQGPRGREGKHGKKGDQGQAGEQGDQGQDVNASEVMHKLAQNTRFKRSLKGEDGSEGPQGERGVDGDPGPRGREGKQGKRGDDGPEGQAGSQGPKGDQGQDGDPGPRGRDGKQGKRGEDGVDGVDSFTLDSGLKRSTRELQKKPQLKIVPGESYDENKKEANIELKVEGKGVVIATFLEIGYFFKNDELYIRNHVTGNNVLIPKNFHFLKVVEDGLDSYKLAFCNNLGNLFFDHKKYDQEYAGLPEEHKLINLKYIKNAVSIDLSKYYYHTHTPLFAVKKGELEGQSLENYRADVYEIEKNKKIGTLIDEFGCFECDLFRHVDHHQGYDRLSQELDVRIGDHEGNFQIGDNIVHPIAFDFDLLNYLDYQINFVLDS